MKHFWEAVGRMEETTTSACPRDAAALHLAQRCADLAEINSQIHAEAKLRAVLASATVPSSSSPRTWSPPKSFPIENILYNGY